MAKRSAGILLYRGDADAIEVLLVHPGGPFWASKDVGVWSIPKGEYDEGEEALACAVREFTEELGATPTGPFLDLGELRQPSRKMVRAWAAWGEFDPATITSSTFEMEWPLKSGRKQAFPEVDRAAWFAPDVARVKILPGQMPFIDRLLLALTGGAG